MERAYFITICTKNREHYFGEIVKGKMVLSQVGIIANVLLNEIPSHFPFVELDDFTVMPNHVHLVLIIDKPLMEGISVWAGQIAGPANLVSPGYDIALLQPSLQPQPSKKKPLLPGQNRFQHIGKNTISSIIGSYKSAVTKHANRLGYKHSWQPRFHDHIIRNDAEYQRISDYIIPNPKTGHIINSMSKSKKNQFK